MKTALVTGGNRGIGQAVCEGLAARGLRVLVAGRAVDEAEAVAASLRAAGRAAESVALDLVRPGAVEALGHELARRGHTVEVLVNNAGLYPAGALRAASPAVLREVMEVHFFGPLALVQALLPGMEAARYGRVVNVSSGYGLFSEGLGGPGAYAVSKAALNALTHKLSQELPPYIKINAVCPGWVRTRMGGAGAPRSPAKGAAEILRLATVPDEGPSGGFFRDGRALSW